MSEDIFVAKSDSADALVGPLHTITFLTADVESLHSTLSQGLAQQVTDHLDPTPEQHGDLDDYLGLSHADGWTARCYDGADNARNVQIRVIAVSEKQPVVRPEINGSYVGGLSIGFPMQNIAQRDERLASLGVKSTVGLKQLEFAGPTGEVYVSGEIHFPVVENVFLLGVQRPDVFVPVGPMDGDIGGAAYSARCVTGTDKLIGFFESALGYECRRDMAMTVGDNSGLLQNEGDPERFVQLFAPGACTGYLVLLDHDQARLPSPAPTLGPPSRGMVMWSFPTRDVDEVAARVTQHGGRVLQDIAKRTSPFLPGGRTVMVEDPDGFPLEFFEA